MRTSGQIPTPAHRFFGLLMLSFIVFTAAVYLSRPLFDPDFYWHLKTGEWIWQHRVLPTADPFGVPPLPEPSPQTRFTLSGYWLAQTVLYGFYALGGMPGIIVFRWLSALALFLICSFWTRIRTGSVAAVVALGTVLLLEFYFIERPQFWSFICFAALIVILFKFMEEREPRRLGLLLGPLVLLMAVWSNLHGGFLIGQAVLAFSVIAEGLKFLHPSLAPLSKRQYRVLALSAAAAILAAALNPHTFVSIRQLPQILDTSTFISGKNLEYLSLTAYFSVSRDYTVILYLLAILLTACAFFSSRPRNLTWFGILAGTATMGALHIRLMPFFIVAALLFLMRYFASGGGSVTARTILFVFLGLTVLHGIPDEVPRLAGVVKGNLVPEYQYPVQAVNHVAATGIRGHLFTTLDWSGYLVWRLGPEQKVFCDGRWIDQSRHREYYLSTRADANPYYWKMLFRKYAIRVVVLPVYDDAGEPNPLARAIAADPDWSVAYADDDEIVLVDRTM